ncbi:hypothetical protein DFH09DRAFT_1098542 [Mycena vulgaris]|nr:hypothetical protein DFH09DRAFT_1098542 [Mycena vulgaris]
MAREELDTHSKASRLAHIKMLESMRPHGDYDEWRNARCREGDVENGQLRAFLRENGQGLDGNAGQRGAERGAPARGDLLPRASGHDERDLRNRSSINEERIQYSRGKELEQIGRDGERGIGDLEALQGRERLGFYNPQTPNVERCSKFATGVRKVAKIMPVMSHMFSSRSCGEGRQSVFKDPMRLITDGKRRQLGGYTGQSREKDGVRRRSGRKSRRAGSLVRRGAALLGTASSVRLDSKGVG